MVIETADIRPRDRSAKISLMGEALVTHLLILMSYNGHIGWNDSGSNMTVDLQKHGVDVMIWTSPNNMFAVEIKTIGLEEYMTAPLEIEVKPSEKRPATKGWLYTLQSDLLLFSYLGPRITYAMRIQSLRSWYDSNGYKYKISKKVDSHIKGKYVRNAIVPWKDLEKGLGKENFSRLELDDELGVMFYLKQMGLWNYAPAHGFPASEYRFGVIYGGNDPSKHSGPF